MPATSSLTADCANCVGLCCVALAFARSADFGFDKAAGEACVNLDDGYLCTIHPHLRESGFKGCTVFDCHGAGQKVTQETFAGSSWRDSPDTRAAMFAVFPVVRQLHEMLWFLRSAAELPAARAMAENIERMSLEVEALTNEPADRILRLDVDTVRGRVNEVLGTASQLVRSAARPATAASLPRKVRAGADLLGADLSGHDLRGADLRGALLIAAKLRDADLRGADLIAADLRDADLSGADLTGALFVTQMLANAAQGDARTRLPSHVRRPSHWA